MQYLIFSIPVIPTLFYLTRKGRWQFLDPINTFWLAYLNFGFLQPLLEKNEWIAYYGEDAFTKTVVMFLVLGTSVAVGYRSRMGKRAAAKIPVLCHVESPSKIFCFGVLVTGIGLLAYLGFVVIAGGWSQFTSVARTAIAFEWDRPGYLLVLPRLVSPGLLVLLCHAFSQEGRKSYKAILVLLALLYTLWLLYTGTRDGVILMALIILGSTFGIKRKNPPFVVLAATVVLVVFLNAFIATYRGQFYNLTFNTEGETSSEIYSQSLDFYMSSKSNSGLYLGTEYGMAIAAAYYIPDSLDYDYGYMLLDVFTKYVPRQVWPEKIYPEADAWDRFHRIANTSNSMNPSGQLSGPAPTMVAKYFYISGWLGLLLGGWFSGWCFRMVWEYVRRYPPIAGTILMVSTAVLGFLEMAHPLGWTILFWVPTVGMPLFLMMFLIRAKSSHSKSPPHHRALPFVPRKRPRNTLRAK